MPTSVSDRRAPRRRSSQFASLDTLSVAGAPPKLGAYADVQATVAAMATLIRLWRNDPRVRTLAVHLAAQGGAALNARQRPDMRDHAAVARAIYSALADRVTYVNDPVRSELVQAPLNTLAREIGDCDDMVVLIGSLLASVGVPVQIVVVGYGSEGYDHTYLEAETRPGQWMTVDLTLGTQVGELPAAPEARRRVAPVVTTGSFGIAGAPASKTATRSKTTHSTAGANLPITYSPNPLRSIWKEKDRPAALTSAQLARLLGVTEAELEKAISEARSVAEVAYRLEIDPRLVQYVALHGVDIREAQYRLGFLQRPGTAPTRRRTQSSGGTSSGASGGQASGGASPTGAVADPVASGELASGLDALTSNPVVLIGGAAALFWLLSRGNGLSAQTSRTVTTTDFGRK